MGNKKVQNIHLYFNVFKLWNELVPQRVECIFMSFLVVFSQIMFGAHNKAVIWKSLERKGGRPDAAVIEIKEFIISKSLERLKT